MHAQYAWIYRLQLARDHSAFPRRQPKCMCISKARCHGTRTSAAYTYQTFILCKVLVAITQFTWDRCLQKVLCQMHGHVVLLFGQKNVGQKWYTKCELQIRGCKRICEAMGPDVDENSWLYRANSKQHKDKLNVKTLCMQWRSYGWVNCPFQRHAQSQQTEQVLQGLVRCNPGAKALCFWMPHRL